MRVNTIQLNNYYSKNNKTIKEISFMSSTSSDATNTAQVEKLPNNSATQTTVQTAFMGLIDAVKNSLAPKVVETQDVFSDAEVAQLIMTRSLSYLI